MILDTEPHRRMWLAVIERACKDSRWIRNNRHRLDLTRHEVKRMGAILEENPDAFLAGEYCREICSMLGINVRPEVLL